MGGSSSKTTKKKAKPTTKKVAKGTTKQAKGTTKNAKGTKKGTDKGGGTGKAKGTTKSKGTSKGGAPMMTIPANWMEECKKNKQWCKKFAEDLVLGGLVPQLFGSTKKIKKAKKDAFKAKCDNDEACIQKAEMDYEIKVVQALAIERSGQVCG